MNKNYLKLQRHEQYACERYRGELFQISTTNGYPDYDLANVEEVVEAHKEKHKPALPWKGR